MASTPQSMLDTLTAIARDAGRAIMDIYETGDFEVELKGDNSPLTKADKAASQIIVAGLAKISDLPVISEENEIREADGDFWLVDPLDGTKEFIKKNGEFTVNIALIERSRAVLGVVYAPVLDIMYAGDVHEGKAHRIDSNGENRQIQATGSSLVVPVIMTSRSHKDPSTEKLLNSIGKHTEKAIGSSLKICLVAEGTATLYPRLAPTYLWDTAAADAVVTASGGAIKSLDDENLSYEPKVNLKNPYFIVESKDNHINWRAVL